MDFAAILIFAATYLTVLIVPGPGVTALVARVLAQGIGCAPGFIAGIVLGALIWFTLAATGLSLLAARFAMVFEMVRWLGAGWLLYLAWTLWRARGGVAAAPVQDGGRQFLAGLAINLGNPKAMAFFLALLPAVVDLGALTLSGFLELALAVVLVATTVLGGYALAAARARLLFTSPRSLLVMRRGGSIAMAGSAAALLAR